MLDMFGRQDRLEGPKEPPGKGRAHCSLSRILWLFLRLPTTASLAFAIFWLAGFWADYHLFKKARGFHTMPPVLEAAFIFVSQSTSIVDSLSQYSKLC